MVSDTKAAKDDLIGRLASDPDALHLILCLYDHHSFLCQPFLQWPCVVFGVVLSQDSLPAVFEVGGCARFMITDRNDDL